MQATGNDPVRANIHALWAGVAPAWSEYADEADEREQAVSARMLERAAVAPGDRVLELACGPGGLGLSAAERVGPDGEVVFSDVAVEMTEIAARRAAERGLRNVGTRRIDLERIDEPDAAYDVVLCRAGLMFAFEPPVALAGIHRVLRPGGRFAAAVWGPRARNPWLAVVFDAVGAQLGVPVPPPGIPGPFALDDADRLTGLLTGAGFTDVAVEEFEVPMHSDSFDEWWSRTRALAGPLATMIAGLPEDVRQALTERVREGVRPFETAAGLEFGGVQLIASGRRNGPAGGGTDAA